MTKEVEQLVTFIHDYCSTTLCTKVDDTYIPWPSNSTPVFPQQKYMPVHIKNKCIRIFIIALFITPKTQVNAYQHENGLMVVYISWNTIQEQKWTTKYNMDKSYT